MRINDDFDLIFSTLSGQIPLCLARNLKVLIMGFLTPCLKMLSDFLLFLNNSMKIRWIRPKMPKIAFFDFFRDFCNFYGILKNR